MLGYVQIFKPDLKVREYEIYNGYYCGICKYIASAYGQLPRMVLSYDAVFFALLLDSLTEEADPPSMERCIMHHIKKRTVIRSDAVSYAGDIMLILAWFKLKDDIADENKASSRAAAFAMRKVFSRLESKYPELCKGIDSGIGALRALEDAKCASMDRAAHTFSEIMELLFSHGLHSLYDGRPGFENTDELADIFGRMGYHLGKWIYLADAVDDIEENIRDGGYNPLIYRFSYDGAAETPGEFRRRIGDDMRFSLYSCLSVLGDLAGSLEIKKNKGIIDNIIYFGLNRRTEELIAGNEEKQ